MTEAAKLAAFFVLPFVVTVVAVHYDRHQIARAALTAAAMPFYAPAWVAGKAVAMAYWIRDAVVAGYKHGRGK